MGLRQSISETQDAAALLFRVVYDVITVPTTCVFLFFHSNFKS